MYYDKKSDIMPFAKRQEKVEFAMNETYVECLVSRKPSTVLGILKGVMAGFVVICFLLSSMIWICLLLALLGCVGFYFAGHYAKQEFEYLYVDREITIDRIMNQSKRKKVDTFDLNEMEIFAPIKSWHLDSYKNREFKVTDYSSGIESQPDKRYVMLYRGNRKVIFEPNDEFVQAIRNIYPRKVFTD